MTPTVERAIEAYGGADLWRRATRIRAVVSASGLAFTLKRRPAFRRAEFACQVHEPQARLSPIGSRPDVVGVLCGGDTMLESPAGSVLETRKNARENFPYGRRLWRWDDLDMAYFANYAFWNYLTLPALLMNPSIHWSEASPGVLHSVFPQSIPTHSRQQRFMFSHTTGLLERYDYTADVIAPVAKAANVVMAHATMGGIPVTSRRRVTPQGPFGRVLPWPLLIDLEIHEFSLEVE